MSAASVIRPVPCQVGGSPYWKKTGGYKHVWERLMTGSTLKKANLTFAYNSSTDTSQESFIKAGGGGWAANGTVKASSQVSASGDDSVGTNTNAEFKIEMEYLEWEERCVTFGAVNDYATGVREMRPSKWLGGSIAQTYSSARFTCDWTKNGTTVGSRLTVSRDVTRTISGGVSFSFGASAIGATKQKNDHERACHHIQ